MEQQAAAAAEQQPAYSRSTMQEQSYYFAILLSLLVIFVVLFVLARRQRFKMKEIQQEVTSLSGVPFQKVDEPTPMDEQAYALIEQERKKIWRKFSQDVEISSDAVLSIAKDMTGKIASVYFPESRDPLYQATIDGLLHLIRRTAERLEGYLNRFPLTIVRDRTVREILLLHNGYKKVIDSKFAKFVGNKYVNMARKIVWNAYNVTNPWYYGRQLAWAVGKEAVVRYLLTLIVTIVGEEAVIVFRRARAKKHTCAGTGGTSGPGADDADCRDHSSVLPQDPASGR